MTGEGIARQFADTRVVELARAIPVAWCARQFAAHGARVVSVEPPGGRPLATAPPLHDGRSLLWEYLSADKELAPLSPLSLPSLVRGADVFLTDLGDVELARLGLGTLTEDAAQLVVVSFSDFGPDGPYAAYRATDLVLQALTGALSFNGEPGRVPLKAPANAFPYGTGMVAMVGALAALVARNRTGRGQLVAVSAVEAMATLVQYQWTEYHAKAHQRTGGVGPPMLACEDGHVFFEYSFERTRRPLLAVLGLEERDLPADPDEIGEFLAERTRHWKADVLFRALAELGAVVAPVRSLGGVLAEEHLAARGLFHDRDGVRIPGPPIRTRTTRTDPAPARPFAGWAPRDEPAGTTGPPGAPLDGVRVLDLTQAWLGPYATMLLGDLGADVIKVESRGRPDVWRVLGTIPPCARPNAHKWNTCHWFNSVNRNKRSLTLDLSDDRGRALLRRLAASCDLVMENYTPPVMARFGLTYDVLRDVNPRAVMVSVSGYGRGGPYSDFKANGASTETISGWVALHGYPGERPMTTGGYPLDPLTGLHMAAAALVGLLDARSTGRGQEIEGSMIESGAAHLGEELMLWSAEPDAPVLHPNRARAMTPHGVFPCAGDDEWVAIAVRDDAEWDALRDAIGDGAFARYGSAEARRAAEDAIEERIAAWTSARAATDVMRTLQDAGVAAGVVHTTARAMDDPHLGRWFVPMDHADVGTHRYYGFPWRFSASVLANRYAPVRVGEHSTEILAGELGLSDTEIAGLVEAGVTRAALEYVPRAGARSE